MSEHSRQASIGVDPHVEQPVACSDPSTFHSQDSQNQQASSDLEPQGNAPNSAVSGSDAATPKTSATQFNPSLLLNPRSAVHQSRQSSQPSDINGATSHSLTANNFHHGSLIERMHGVQERQEQPLKRVKRDHESEEEPPSKSSTFEAGGKGTILGNYIKEQRQNNTSNSVFQHQPVPSAAAIDLTADDDEDDDVIFVGDNSKKEVCLGKLDRSYVNAFQVPQQKPGGHQGSKGMWPSMSVSLQRNPGGHMVIHARDPSGKIFGSLDVKTASGLAPLMDGSKTNGLRVSAKLEPRSKRAGEIAGQTTNTSTQIFVVLILYSPRKYADAIGAYLSKKQLWLRIPPKFDSNVEYYNPQAPSVARTKSSTGNGLVRQGTGVGGSTGDYTYGSSYVPRTVEEIRNDVMNMFDSLTKTEDLPEKEQDSRIKTQLLSHQKQALFFMTDRESEHEIQENRAEKYALWTIRRKKDGRRVYYNVITGYETLAKPPPTLGGILADMMGLGKTLSILSLVVSSLDQAAQWAQSQPAPDGLVRTKATLLVCPVSTVVNWEEQLKMHLQDGTLSCYIYHGPNRTRDVGQFAKYDMVITTYSVAAADFGNARSTKPLENIDWFRIVLDEAHMIRTQSTRQSQAICSLSSQRRWAVTGTPVQNRLDDLGALIKFLRIKPFDEKNGFAQFILSPFKNADPEILPKLRLLVDSITLRRQKDKIDLPRRTDKIVKLEFTPDERKLYDHFARTATATVNAVTGDRNRLGGKVYVHILRAILRLRLICAHGTELLSDEDMKATEGLSYGNAIDLGDEDEEDKPALTQKQAFDMYHLLKESDMDTCSACQRKLGQPDDDEDAKEENILGYMLPCFQIICLKCMPFFRRRVQEQATTDNYMSCPLCDQYVRISFFELAQDKLEEDEQARANLRNNTRLTKQLTRYTGPHTKTRALLNSLLQNRQWSEEHPEEPPLKSVVFSGWTTHLDLIEIALNHCSPPLLFTRLDGRMTRRERTRALDTFREDPSIPIILVSIAAGGLGLNLTSGSHVYVMEPQFNPAAEAQAVDRVHRLGQKREVVVSRFIMHNSFEEKMLELQRKKTQLAEMSLSKEKLGKGEEQRKKMEDLRSLFR